MQLIPEVLQRCPHAAKEVSRSYDYKRGKLQNYSIRSNVHESWKGVLIFRGHKEGENKLAKVQCIGQADGLGKLVWEEKVRDIDRVRSKVDIEQGHQKVEGEVSNLVITPPGKTLE